MFSGHRSSRKANELDNNMKFQGDAKYDDFGVPLSSGSPPAAQKKGFFNRFKPSTRHSNHDMSSDDDGSFDELPAMSNIPSARPPSVQGSNFNAYANNTNQQAPQQFTQGFQTNAMPPPNQQAPQPLVAPQGSQPSQVPINPNQGQHSRMQSNISSIDGSIPGMHPGMPHSAGSFQMQNENVPVGSNRSSMHRGDGNLDEVQILPDRIRYPNRKSGTLSMTSMSNYDSTPFIPVLTQPMKPQSKKNPNDNYRHKVIESRNALMSAETTVPYTGDPAKASQIPQQHPQTAPPAGIAPPNGMHTGLQERTMSMSSMNSGRSRQFGNQPYSPYSPATGSNPNLAPMMPPMMPGANVQARNSSSNLSVASNSSMRSGPHPPMSAGAGYPVYGHPMPPPMAHGTPVGTPMGSPAGSPMTGPPAGMNAPMYSPGPVGVPPNGIPPNGMPQQMQSMAKRDAEMKIQISNLEDSVRVLSVELAESSRRELGLKADHEAQPNVVAQAHNELILLRSQIKNLEASYHGMNRDQEAQNLKRIAELEHRHSEATHLLSIRTEQYENLQNQLVDLETQFTAKNAELLEMTAEFKNQTSIEATNLETQNLGSEVQMLQLENDKLKQQLKEQGPKGTLNDRITALEDQRKALQEALRTMKESKDLQIEMLKDKISTLQTDGKPRSVTQLSSLYGEQGSKLSLVDEELLKPALNSEKFPRLRSVTPLSIGSMNS